MCGGSDGNGNDDLYSELVDEIFSFARMTI